MASIVKKANHRAVQKLEARIISLTKFRFSPEELQQAAIQVVPASFKCPNGRPDFTPCFFDPFPRELLVIPKNESVATEFPEYNDKLSRLHEEKPIDRARQLYLYLDFFLAAYGSRNEDAQYTVFSDSGWCYKDIFEYGFKNLGEYGPPQIGVPYEDCPPQWEAEAVYHHKNPKFPHLKSMMIANIDGDDESLFRGELLALIRMIKRRLVIKDFDNQTIHPVLLFSMMGRQHARILQAYFNGTELVIHRSNLYDFRYENPAPLELFAQWFLSTPVS